jgi:hypothetical protein
VSLSLLLRSMSAGMSSSSRRAALARFAFTVADVAGAADDGCGRTDEDAAAVEDKGPCPFIAGSDSSLLTLSSSEISPTRAGTSLPLLLLSRAAFARPAAATAAAEDDAGPISEGMSLLPRDAALDD